MVIESHFKNSDGNVWHPAVPHTTREMGARGSCAHPMGQWTEREVARGRVSQVLPAVACRRRRAATAVEKEAVWGQRRRHTSEALRRTG